MVSYQAKNHQNINYEQTIQTLKTRTMEHYLKKVQFFILYYLFLLSYN